METKICNKCGYEKLLTEFHKVKGYKNGVYTVCKDCRKIENVNNRDNIKEYNRQYREKNREKLNDYEESRKDTRKDYLKKYNKLPHVIEMRKNRDKKRADKRKEERKESDYYSKWYEINKEKIKQQRKEYREKNKEIIKEKKREYIKLRMCNDNVFKMKYNIRQMIYNSLRNKGYTKKSRTHEILGCTYDAFILHLESKFESWMNWDNHGLYNGTPNYGWDIDHIIPQSSATTEEELLMLNHYTNLQPLCSYINRDVKKHYLPKLLLDED